MAIREEKSAFEKRPEARTLAESLLVDGVRIGLSAGQLVDLRHAVRLQSGTKADRRRSRAIAEGIQRHVRGGINESIALEQARGGEVVDPKAGPVRMKARDGLHTLFESGAISPGQYEAGLVYRAGYEALGSGLGSQLAERTGGYGGKDALLVARLNQAKAGLLRAQIERRVALELKDDPNCLVALRSVAGQGHTVWSQVQGGAARVRYAEALQRALDVAVAVLRL